MTRLAGITAAYALIAALVLVAPLSASDEPAGGAPTETAAPEDAPPEDVAVPEAVPPSDAVAPAEQPPATAPAPQPAGAAPVTDPAGTPADPIAPTPADPAAAAQPTAIQTDPAAAAPGDPASAASDKPDSRRSRDRSGPRAKAAANAAVTISDFQFAPSSVTVDAGDTVTWTNDGPTPHSATADDGSFDTGIFEAGQSRSHTFEQAGTFSYFCTPHPNMRGTVTVRAASTGGSGGDGAGTGGGAESTGGTTGESGTASGGSSDSSGTELPATGLDAGGLIVLGLTTLALGAWLRRRAAAAG